MTKEKEACKTAIESMNFIASHITKFAHTLDEASVSDLINGIMNAKRIFLIGAGRSGFVARAFAMRLMHMGFDAYVIGEATTPAIKPEDILIAVSGTGKTPLIADLGVVAKRIGSKLATITTEKDSILANDSDIIVVIPGKNINESYETQIAPLGTLFELTALVFLDSLISDMMVRKGISEKDMNERHLFSGYVCLF
jgi:6-phospho-3-hexuloisomerase